MSRETVSDVGEFGLIARLGDALPVGAGAVSSSIVQGIGDDAATWQSAPAMEQVISTDALIEGVHFRLDWTEWDDLGHKSLAVNLSDLAAMGAIPRVAVVTLGIRGDELVEDLEAMYHEMGALAARHGVVIVGGDIVRVPDERMISVTAIGEVEEGKALLRSTGKVGDVVAVTGTISASAAGLEVLRDPESYRNHTTAPRLVQAHLRPEPRIDAGRLLVEHEVRTAMDLSDGLGGDLPKILEASRVSAVIHEERLPVIAAVRALFPDRWVQLALHGGEDYELLFTVPEERFQEIAQAGESRGITITAIGEILPLTSDDPELRIRQSNGEVAQLPVGAFDHFG